MTDIVIDPNFDIHDKEWREDVNCYDQPPEAFYLSLEQEEATPLSPALEERIAAAKLICAACTVRPECLNYALATKQMGMIWGGMTPLERQELLERQ